MLKPACVNALKRIFKLCDKNKDGLLDSAELNDFQVIRSPGPRIEMTNRFLQSKCFDAPLQTQELEGIKEMVQRHGPGMVIDDGLTEAGFLYLNTIFIQGGRLETTWTILRSFGYGEDLKLVESFLSPK